MNIERLKKLFGKHPNQDKIFVTSDGQMFFNQNDADGQAGNLKHAGKSDAVTTVTRGMIELREKLEALKADITATGDETIQPDPEAGKTTGDETKLPETAQETVITTGGNDQTVSEPLVIVPPATVPPVTAALPPAAKEPEAKPKRVTKPKVQE